MLKDLKIDFPAVLAICTFALFATVIVAAALFKVVIDADLKQTLVAIVMLVVGFYFGSSAGSKAKDAALMPPPDKA